MLEQKWNIAVKLEVTITSWFFFTASIKLSGAFTAQKWNAIKIHKYQRHAQTIQETHAKNSEIAKKNEMLKIASVANVTWHVKNKPESKYWDHSIGVNTWLKIECVKSTNLSK